MQRIEKDLMGNSAVCPAPINLDRYLGSGGGGGRSQLPDVRCFGHVRNRQTINADERRRKDIGIRKRVRRTGGTRQPMKMEMEMTYKTLM